LAQEVGGGLGRGALLLGKVQAEQAEKDRLMRFAELVKLFYQTLARFAGCS
tara:strand:+ start:1361 stop:1513 length:153 start_codon:yes stop_codon:yes gene_type:complete